MQSVTTLTRDCNAKPGMIWARHTVAGRLGKPNLQVCVDCTWLSLGRPATMGLLASCTLVTRVPVVRKLLVVPESKMALLVMVSMSISTVQRGVAAARAYGWVGVCHRPLVQPREAAQKRSMLNLSGERSLFER